MRDRTSGEPERNGKRHMERSSQRTLATFAIPNKDKRPLGHSIRNKVTICVKKGSADPGMVEG